MENESVYPLPLENTDLKRNTSKRFSFFNNIADVKQAKYLTYRPAKIHQGKKWFVEYYFRDPETQKFERFKVYENLNRIKDPKEKLEFATQLRDAINYHLDHGYDPFQQEMKIVVRNWTLVQGLNYFKQNLGNRGLRERSIKLYGSVLKALYKYLAPVLNEDIKKITRNHIQSAFRKGQTEKKWTNSTYNNYITFTRTIFNFLKDEGVIEQNPAHIKSLPENFKRHKAFSKEVFDKIMAESDKELQEFIMFLYHTTARPNEAVQLFDTDFLMDRKLLHIKDTISKTRKERFIPLSEYLLQRYPKGKGKVFNVRDRYFTDKFKKVKDTLELPPEYTLYSIKHTRCLHLAEDGVSIYFIMQLLGHSNPMTTMSYLRDLGANVNREAVEKGIKF